MVASFRVFKKTAPNGKLTLYLGKRDFVDHLTSVEPIDGVLVIDQDYLQNRRVFGQVICSFRYGREDEEVMGLSFQKDMTLVSEQVYPKGKVAGTSKLQEHLLKKLGANAIPFKFDLTHKAPSSVTIQPGPNDTGKPCGVEYTLKFFVGESEEEKGHKRSTVSLGIRKIQYAPPNQGRQPCTVVKKDFMLSPGELELEATLDKQLYHHGDTVAVNICVRNHSNKAVKKMKCSIQQNVDISIYATGQYKTTVAQMETQEGCPVEPGSSLQKIVYLVPSLTTNKNRFGVALDGQLKKQDTNLASTTLLADMDADPFGITVSYIVKVKLFLGALGGELAAELPFILMHPKPNPKRLIHEDSQAVVETFRQDTIDQDQDCITKGMEGLQAN